MMGFRQVLIAAMVIILFLLPKVVIGDPVPHTYENKLIIEGAHIVSEGAYFRFWVKNNFSVPINVTINDSDTFYILPYGSINYNVVAPSISVPYEKITYTFKLYFLINNDSEQAYIDKSDFTVLVLNSSFVQVFDIIVPFLIILAIVLAVAISVFMIRRRRISSRRALTIQKEA